MQSNEMCIQILEYAIRPPPPRHKIRMADTGTQKMPTFLVIHIHVLNLN